MKTLRAIFSLLVSLLGLTVFAQLSWAQEAQVYTFTLPAGQAVWNSETISTPQAFDFIALRTDSFEEHLDLEVKIKENGVEQWRELELHNEYGEGLEAMVTTEALNALEIRYNGQALKKPVQITVNLFPVQQNQGLAKAYLDPNSLVAGEAMGGNEAIPMIIPRSVWGADESMRYVDRSTSDTSTSDPCRDLVEKYPQDFQIGYSAEYATSAEEPYWAESYAPAHHLVIHHTTTANVETQAPAIVRSIYQYHTVTRGWGDIGYNYLIAPDGTIYEGRYGGEYNGMPVVAGHARCSNIGTIGIALIGNYQENAVPAPMMEALTDLTAFLSDKHNLDPLAQNLWHGKMQYVIGGHRDFQATACPGETMYSLLPKVREATELKLRSNYSGQMNPQEMPYNAQAVTKEKTLSLNPNQQQTVTVEFKNTGTQTWTNQTWLYGIVSGQQIITPLIADKPFVLANLSQAQVAPGQAGSFKIKLQAPFQKGDYVAYMAVVADNKVKLSSGAMTLKISVSEPVLNYELVQKNLPSGDVKAGTSLKDASGNWHSIHLKNTGNVTWLQSNTTINASAPKERSSLFSGGPIMARLVQTQVAPGEVGEFLFQGLQVPTAKTGEAVEQFIPVIQDSAGTLHWLPDQALGFRVNIVGGGGMLSSADLLQALPTTSTMQNPFRVKLSYTPERDKTTVVTSNQPFYLRNIKGGPYLKLPAGATVDLKQWNTGISFNTSTKQKALVTGLKIIPSEGGILEIRSWEHRPSWNPELNDNQFRGNLEFRIDSEDQTFLTINELPLEDYLKGIAEVSNSDHAEKQKVLAVLARSYAQFYLDPANRKFPGKLYDGSDDPNVFQKYLGYGLEKRSPNWVKAVQETAGQVVKYNGKLVKTPYFNESDGRTRSAQEVWGWIDTPYLQSVDDKWCKEGQGTLAGHGVGLSGCGATAMAEAGKSFGEIIQYYYQGVEVNSI